MTYAAGIAPRASKEPVRLPLLAMSIAYVLPAVIAHGVVVAVVSAFALRAGTRDAAFGFITCEVALHVVALTFYRRFHPLPVEALAEHEAIARGVLRGLGAALGLAIGWAGAMWSHATDPTLALATVVALAGSAAGATMASGPDPTTCRLMLAGITLPPVVIAASEQPVEAIIWLTYSIGCAITNAYIYRILTAWIVLRREKDALLASAVLERRATERARDEAEKTAMRLQRFLAAASHDLRQPAQALSLFVDLLKDADAEQQAIIVRGSLRQSVALLRATLDALFDISSFDADKVVVEPTVVGLRDVADQLWAGTRELCVEHDVTLTITRAGSYVLVDHALLARTLHNLTSNAIRHSGSDRVLVAFRRRGLFTVVQVWDRGVGVPAADQERIFDEFVQVGDRERSRDRGLGLGLPIVRRICERCGWALTFESVPGRGTRVSIALPMTAPPEDARASAPWDIEPCRVLLVEDDPLVLDATKTWLVGAGFDVTTATSTDRAIALIRERPDLGLLLTDVRLPGAAPFKSLVEAARARSPEPLAMIAMTGDLDLPAGLDRSVAQVLRKPVSGRDLAAAIGRVQYGAERASGAPSGGLASIPPTTVR
jgi:signal transduction histidine kinase/ActR/RegA family two-component response regulator